MAVTVNTSIPSFKANSPQEKCEHKICPKCGQSVADSCDTFSKPDSASQKSTAGKIKDNFIKFRKYAIDYGYLALGAVKGSIYGLVAGFATAGVIAVRNIFKKSPKTLGIGGKILSGAVGLAVLAGHVVKSKLDANEAKAGLDHRWETGHNEQ